jgi:hypothetical protein
MATNPQDFAFKVHVLRVSLYLGSDSTASPLLAKANLLLDEGGEYVAIASLIAEFPTPTVFTVVLEGLAVRNQNESATFRRLELHVTYVETDEQETSGKFVVIQPGGAYGASSESLAELCVRSFHRNP